MKTLGTRNITLLVEGLRTTGTFVDAYSYIEERLYSDEADTIYAFCKWADEEIGGGAERNMEILFQAFINPKDKENYAKAMEIKEKIAEINSLMENDKIEVKINTRDIDRDKIQVATKMGVTNDDYYKLAELRIEHRGETAAQDIQSYIDDFLLDYLSEEAHEQVADSVQTEEEEQKIYAEVLGEFSEAEKAILAKELKWHGVYNLDTYYANREAQDAADSIIDNINAHKLNVYVNTGIINHDTTKTLEL